MIPKTFAIDFVRAIIDYKLSFNDDEEYYSNDNYNGIANFSFYEHLASDEEVNRYKKTFEELTRQQNRTHLAGFGIFSFENSPTITNLYDAFISPFEFAYRVRCKLANRDKMLGTLYHLIDELKGRKVDVAQFDTGVLFPVGTITNELKVGDFVGEITENVSIDDLITNLSNIGIEIPTFYEGDYLYAENNGKLVRYEYLSSLWVENETYFINNLEHKSFTKYKVSLALNDIAISQPFTLNSEEMVTFLLGGSATLVNSGVRLGNDLVRVFLKKYKIITSDNANSDIYFDTLATNENKTNDYYEVEPLELPSNANANTFQSQLRSNFFLPNSHTDSVGHLLQYSFACDMENDLLKSFFNYARYHECNLGENNTIVYDSITPNIIYEIVELWSAWGNVDKHTSYGKLIEDIDIENTEADITTISLSFQLQSL